MSESKLVPGLTSDNATYLLAAAEELGLDPGVVQVDHSAGGFTAPAEVVDRAGLGETRAEAPVQRTARTAKKAAAKKTAAKKAAAPKAEAKADEPPKEEN